MVVSCAYMEEWFVAWFSGNEFEKAFFANRIWGQWWWASAILYTCNMVLPLSLTMEGATMRSKDMAEAVKAFQEKREPKFEGR